METHPTIDFLGTKEFERCKPYIEAALEYTGGTHDLIDIYEGLYKGTMQLWPAEKSCLVSPLTFFREKSMNT